MSESEDVKAADDAATPESETEAAEPAAESTNAPSAEADSENETEDAEASDGDDDETDEPRPKRKRPGRLERRLTRLETENAQLRQHMQQAQQPAAKAAPKPAPKMDDFETIEDYLEAAVDHRTEAKLETLQTQARQRRDETAKQRQEREAAEKSRAWMDKGEDAVEGFTDIVMDPDFTVTPIMADALTEATNGHAAALYLADHPEEIQRIAGLSATGQAMAIASLAAKSTLPGKKRSKTPPPARALQGGSKAVPDPSKMTNEQYYEYRTKQMKAG